jgi:hypothetical protein
MELVDEARALADDGRSQAKSTGRAVEQYRQKSGKKEKSA